MSRGPSGSTVVFDWTPDGGLATPGVWRHLQNPETTTSNQVIANWPNGSPTRTTLPTMTRYDGSTGKVVRFELRNGDLFDGRARAELSGALQAWTFKEGQETWIQYPIMVPADFAISGPGYFIITQLHGGSNASMASPPLTLSFDDDRNLRVNSNADATSAIVLTKAEFDALRGQWLDINLHIKHSVSSSVGGFEVHVNGVQKVAWTPSATMTSDESYFKYGIYRNTTVTSTNVIHFGGLRITTGVETGGSTPPPGGSGAVTPAGSVVAEADGVSSLACNVPAGTAEGDLLVAAVTQGVSGDVPDQAGWTGVTKVSLGSASTGLFYRWATASEPASYTFTVAGAGRTTVSMHRLTGVDPTTVLDVAAGTATNASSATLTTPSLTTVSDGAFLLYVAAAQTSSGTITEPASITQLTDTTAVGRRQFVGYDSQATAGATGTRTFSLSSALPNLGIVAALRPSATAGGSASAPTVDAGADLAGEVNTEFTRTAGENDGGSAITGRQWEILSGPVGAGAVLADTVSVTGTFTTPGTYVLRYSATNAVGTGYDDLTAVIQPEGTLADVVLVQSAQAATNFGTTQNVTSLTIPLNTPAAAGDLLLAGWSVNNSADTFSVPEGWQVLGARSAGAISFLVAGIYASGGETSVTATWTSAEVQASGAVIELSGVHPDNPYGPSQFPSYVEDYFTSLSLNLSPAVAKGAAITFLAAEGVGAVGEFEPSAPGWVRAHAVRSPDGNPDSSGLALLHDLTVDKGADASATFSWVHPAKVMGLSVLINAAGTDVSAPEEPAQVGTRPNIYSRFVGFPEVGLARVAVNFSGVRARLKVGSDPAVTTDIRWGPYATPNAQGDAKLSVGLPQTLDSRDYYARVAMVNAEGGEWLDIEAEPIRLVSAPAGRSGLSFCFGSCLNSSDTAVGSRVAERRDDLFIITGDFYYADNSGTGISNFRSKFDAKLRATNMGRAMATTPTIYVPDDHDGMTNDGTWSNNSTGWTNWNSVYREKLAHPSLVQGTRGVYWARPWGTNIRIVALDTRSYAQPGTTVLGSTQKQWFKDQITAMNEDLMVIVQGATWQWTTSNDTPGEDGWEGTVSEKNELDDFIKASGKQVIMLAGDMHAVGGDDGRNVRGGFPLFHAAPFRNSASQKGGPYSAGVYPASGTTVVEQYGRVTIDLSDTSMQVEFTGFSSNNTVRKRISKTFTATPPPEPLGRTVEVWGGSSLVSRRQEVWTGSALVPRTAD